MAWFVVQSLVILVLAFGLGLAVGWLVWARRRPAGTGVAADLAALDDELAALEGKRGILVGVGRIESDPPSDDTAADADDADADDAVDATSEDVAAADPIPTGEAPEEDEAPEETAAGRDDATSSAVGTDVDTDVAALAVAVGALNEPDDDTDDRAQPDDIERIEGIGPKIGKALRAAGLDTYAAIADASPESLREAIKAGGVKFAPSIESWSGQARLLADGDESGFEALTGRLVAGRVKD